MSKLGPFFEPRTIAVIGASNVPERPGYTLFENLARSSFKGKVYPVNQREKDVLGVRAYKSIGDIEGEIDLADIIVPYSDTLRVLKECADKGVKAVMLAAAGFAETGEAGAELQREAVNIAELSGMRLIGPNTSVLMNVSNGLNSTFAKVPSAQKGSISIVTQSGGVCCSLLGWLEEQHVGLSKLIDLGNKCDVDETDVLKYFADDTHTKVIGIYLEDIRDGQRFLKLAKEVTKDKVVLVLKGGGTEAGKKAARSHTGALANNDIISDVAFRQSGIIRVETLEEFIDYLKVFETQPLMRGNRISVLASAGGHAVVASDTAERHGLRLAEFSQGTIDRISAVSPYLASITNPVDFGGQVFSADIYYRVLEQVLEDENVDAVAMIIYFWVSGLEKMVELLIDLVKTKTKKPITFCGGAPKSVMNVDHQLGLLEQQGIPIYPSPERAVKALSPLYRRYRSLRDV